MRNNVLITGITGQVGSQLADYILANTVFDVVGMMRWQEPLDNLYHLTDRINKKDRISLYYADLNDAGSVRNMIEEVQPRYISHLAAQSYPKTSFDIPIASLQSWNVLVLDRLPTYTTGSCSPASINAICFATVLSKNTSLLLGPL